MKVMSVKPASFAPISANESAASEIDGKIDDEPKSNEVQKILKSNEIQQILNQQNSNIEAKQLNINALGISEILPNLYLCGAGVLTSTVMEQLNIKFVVNIAPELPDTPLPDSKPLYLRINVYDRGDIDLKSHFDIVSNLIEEIRIAGGKSLVHCVAGVSRSASLCIAYLVKHMGMNLRDAYRHVKKARPIIRPNLGFFKQLMKYEEEINNESTVKLVYCASLDKEIPDVFEPEYKAMEEFYQKCRKIYQRSP